MGKGTTEAVAQVEQTRARLDAEVAELQRRVPPMVEQAKRKALTGAAAAGGAVVLLVGLRITVKAVGRRRTATKAAKAAALTALPAKVLGGLPEKAEHLARMLPERLEQVTGRVEELADRLAS